MDNQKPHYTRERLLGQGGMGKVYLAQDNQLQRQVAIKELTYQATNDGSSQALQEARLLARVNHQNIIQIYNVHDEGDHLSLVMEYFKSKTLTQYQHESRCTLLQKVDLLQQLAAGIASAHKSGVIHCDLKPTNILVNQQGQLKVTDFGIALLASHDGEQVPDSQSNTESAPLLFGSLLYMSPEQINKQTVDYRSDIFSLGIIAYQLMVGSHPFGSGSANEIAKRICTERPDNAKYLMLDAPNALTELLMEMLIQPVQQRRLTASVIENRLTHIKNALLQAEISEQETMPLNTADNSVASSGFNTAVIDESYTQSVTQYQTYNPTMPLIHDVVPTTEQGIPKGQSNKYWIAGSFVFLLCLIFGIYSFGYTNQAVENKQVVILKPSLVDSDAMAPMQQDLVISALEDALRQAVINTQSMYLIPQREVNAITKAYPDDLQKLQQAVGASDIIATELSCDNSRCKVNFSRLVKTEQNKRLSVKSERNWLTPIDKFNAIFNNSQTQFASLFPEESDVNQSSLVQRPIKEDDYREYLALYSEIKGHGNNRVEKLTELETLLQRSPYLYAGYSLYSRTAFDLFSETRIIEHLNRLQVLLDNSPPDYKYSAFHAINLFGLALNKSDLQSAAHQIGEAKKRGANDFILLELNAMLLFSKGEYQQAADAFNESINMRPSTALLYNLALSYLNLDKLKEAEIVLSDMLSVVPEQTKAKGLQAGVWLLQGRLDLAVTAYEKLVLNSDNGNYLTNLSLAYGLNKQYKEAYSTSHKALLKAPKHPVNMMNLADIEKILGNEKQAIAHYQEITAILENKSDVLSLTIIAQAYGQLNQAHQAIEALSQAQALAPNSGEVAYSSAIVYSLLKENSSAVHYVKSALNNNIGAVWFNLPWFSELCSSTQFTELMQKYNNSSRCKS